MAALLRRADRVLLCHRSPSRAWYPNVWDLPGGHVEPGEQPASALARELREELGVRIAAPSTPPVARLLTSDYDLSTWVLDEWAGEPTNRVPAEHDALRWCDLASAAALDLADAGYLALIERAVGPGARR